MKANLAQEKIYLTPLECMAASCQPKKDNTIEYTRTDAFIEKTWAWIENNILSSNQQDKALLYYEQFKKYLEK